MWEKVALIVGGAVVGGTIVFAVVVAKFVQELGKR